MPLGNALPANAFRCSVLTSVATPPESVIGTPLTTGGTLAAGTYYIVVTATVAGNESIASSQIAVVTTGATGSIVVNWSAVPGATAYRIYVGTVSGVTNQYFAFGAVLTGTITTAAGTGGSPPAGTWAPIGLMNTSDVSHTGNVAEFDVFDSDDPITLQGKPRRTLSLSGFLGDADTGQLALLTSSASKSTTWIKFLWDGSNGFIQACKINAYKGNAKAGNQPIDLSFDFMATKAAGTIVGAGPLL